MATYVVLHRITDKGMANMKELAATVKSALKDSSSFGATLKASYLVMGRYDAVCIWEAASDEAMAGAALRIAATGWLTVETMRAFSIDEFAKLAGALP